MTTLVWFRNDLRLADNPALGRSMSGAGRWLGALESLEADGGS